MKNLTKEELKHLMLETYLSNEEDELFEKVLTEAVNCQTDDFEHIGKYIFTKETIEEIVKTGFSEDEDSMKEINCNFNFEGLEEELKSEEPDLVKLRISLCYLKMKMTGMDESFVKDMMNII